MALIKLERARFSGNGVEVTGRSLEPHGTRLLISSLAARLCEDATRQSQILRITATAGVFLVHDDILGVSAWGYYIPHPSRTK